MLLIITACIKVDENTPFVEIRSKQDRIDGYIETIEWALKSQFFDEIIFCDNSNVNLKEEQRIKELLSSNRYENKRIEFYAFQGNREMVNQKGKGYGEGEILEYIWNTSKMMKESNFFYKITGRLTVNNIADLKPYTYTQNTFRFDVVGGSVDTRFYRLLTEDYRKYFINAYKHVDDYSGKYLEFVYYDVLEENNLKYGRFNREIEYRGRSGTCGVEYCDEYKDTLVKRIINRSALYSTKVGRMLLKAIRSLLSKD